MLIAYSISNNFFEPKAFNFMVKNFTAVKTGSNDIVIIVIDDKSIGKYRWPWKRNLYCKVFNYLNEYAKPKVIVNDSIFATPDSENPKSDMEYFNCIKKINNLVVGFDFLPNKTKVNNNTYDYKFNKKFGLDIKDARNFGREHSYQTLLAFPEPYFNSIKMVGSVKSPVSRDSFLRSIPYVVSYKDKLYPSLSLRAFSYIKKMKISEVKNHEINRSGETRRRAGTHCSSHGNSQGFGNQCQGSRGNFYG